MGFIFFTGMNPEDEEEQRGRLAASNFVTTCDSSRVRRLDGGRILTVSKFFLISVTFFSHESVEKIVFLFDPIANFR